MRRFILTGTPGAGKTAILRQLEIEGFGVVEEAATDVIALEQAKGVAEPWSDPGFIDKLVLLQRARTARGLRLPVPVQFHNRTPICTAARDAPAWMLIKPPVRGFSPIVTELDGLLSDASVTPSSSTEYGRVGSL